LKGAMQASSGKSHTHGRSLPPGQRRVDGFPRFGTHFHRPPPDVPAVPTIEITGAVQRPLTVPVGDLADLPRHELLADFHCVAGWSATDLRWEGVSFRVLYATIIEPLLTAGAPVSHFVFGGLDGFEAVLLSEDALDDDVLIADRLDGAPLGGDHGAPARLVTPKQYGYMNVKHLSHIEVRTAPPAGELGAATTFARLGLRGPLVMRHPRARVWQEERHPRLPPWLLRPLYRLTIRPGMVLARRRR
jgi:DMSO/TMAO reductase YedYZ molybdopterin-dependent catalytic subunit